MLSIQLATLFAKSTKLAKCLVDVGELGRIYHARSTGYRRRGRPFVDGYGTETFVQKRHSAGGALYDMEINSTFEEESTDWRWHQLDDTQSAYDGPQPHWIAALQGRVPLLPTAELALQTMLISEGIYLSDRLGREVTAGEVLENSTSTAAKA